MDKSKASKSGCILVLSYFNSSSVQFFTATPPVSKIICKKPLKALKIRQNARYSSGSALATALCGFAKIRMSFMAMNWVISNCLMVAIVYLACAYSVSRVCNATDTFVSCRFLNWLFSWFRHMSWSDRI